MASVAVALYTCALAYARSHAAAFVRLLYLLLAIEALYLVNSLPPGFSLYGLPVGTVASLVCELGVVSGIALVGLGFASPRWRRPLALGTTLVVVTTLVTCVVLGQGYRALVHGLGFLLAIGGLAILWFGHGEVPASRLRRRFAATTLGFVPLDMLDLFGQDWGWTWAAPLQGQVIAVYLIVISVLISAEAWRWFARPPVSPPQKAGPDLAGLELSSRQEEVARFILRGLSAKEIAQQLDLSPKTVENHTYSIFRKAGVSSRLQFYETFRD